MNNGTTIPTAAALRAYATNDKFAAKVSIAHYFVRRLSKNVWLFLLSINAKKIWSPFLFSITYQEKVEEDRYIREQEKEFFEKKKAEHSAEMALKDQEIFQKQIAPVMVQVQELLKKTNDSVSSHGLEAIARWKLNL